MLLPIQKKTIVYALDTWLRGLGLKRIRSLCTDLGQNTWILRSLSPPRSKNGPRQPVRESWRIAGGGGGGTVMILLFLAGSSQHWNFVQFINQSRTLLIELWDEKNNFDIRCKVKTLSKGRSLPGADLDVVGKRQDEVWHPIWRLKVKIFS